ncbi:tryptophan halogenase family protein [Echinimonas agarilytica]|uniref:Tryptophan 7-halogenase n=1 Tax=Echinimonas agarilytica TaxID=1215918 RepID=A0AA41W5G2_9GAMM|nr:tryptophan halogenase family protein [Echinimonas agarilytica]MCM2679369.1 tryptophan 7-halogenase [Echinimonas agarilytica]
MKKIEKILIVGGGTAGWMTAGTIAAAHGERVSITLVESPNIKPIGVGEGTWPTMRSTLEKMGISETNFIRECDVSFKQGAKFAQWVTGAKDDAYYHPLVLPQGFFEGNLAPYWLQHGKDKSFSAATCFQEHLCEKNLAPKQLSTPEYSAVANYAYHLDSAKFSAFLQRHCIENLGIQHVLDDVTTVNGLDDGDIASVETQSNGALEADLFIDCTGFKSLLLGEHLNVPFKSCADVLFIDRALAVQVPYKNADDPIASHTISTAQESGWIWDIGLPTRRGVGHVYSSRHTTKERASEELRQYLTDTGVENPSQYEFREIPINSGHREKFWHRNCVAVGLSAGFLEPLEASALVLVELSASMIAEQLPANRQTMDIVARRFNDTFDYRWQRIIDFLKLHYVLTQRKDTAFWRDNCDPATIPESLKELMTLWKYHHPWNHDFSRINEVFPAASYQYVLYGMGFETEAGAHPLSAKEIKFGNMQFQQNMKHAEKLSKHLPTNRDLLMKLKTHGFQKV